MYGQKVGAKVGIKYKGKSNLQKMLILKENLTKSGKDDNTFRFLLLLL